MGKQKGVERKSVELEEGVEDTIEVSWIEHPLGCYQDKVAMGRCQKPFICV
jgi:hypothetical protein